jgi:hypothetical protein
METLPQPLAMAVVMRLVGREIPRVVGVRGHGPTTMPGRLDFATWKIGLIVAAGAKPVVHGDMP